MKPSRFYHLYKDEKFLDLFRQVMTIIIGETIIYYSQRDEQGNFIIDFRNIDLFKRKIRDFCYTAAIEGDGFLDKNIITLRALFDLSDEDDLVYDDNGAIDLDGSFPILYQKIKSVGLISILANAKPEDNGVY